MDLMWPFSSLQKDLNTLPPISFEGHTWSVARATYDNSPVIVRFNSSAKQWIGHKALAIRLGFAIPLNAPNDGGLPNPEENQQLNDVEDAILREVDVNAKGIYAFVVTTGTMKEFVFYITENVDIAAIHKAIQHAVSTHEVQCMAVKDPGWDAYKKITGG
jgi:hypothetical protein